MSSLLSKYNISGNTISSKFKNVVNNHLPYLERNVMDHMKSDTVEWKYITLTFFNTPTLGKGVMGKNIAFWSEHYVLMQCECIYQFQMCIKIQHSVFKISNNEENVINPANLLSLWSTPPSSRGIDHTDRRS